MSDKRGSVYGFGSDNQAQHELIVDLTNVSSRANYKLSRRDFLKATGIAATGIMLSACTSFLESSLTPTSVHTSTETRLSSITPTNTSLPTETITPTPVVPKATPVPNIKIPLLTENGQIIVRDGRALFDFSSEEVPFDKIPSVNELSAQLHAEAYSSQFISAWHKYLINATVNGYPLVSDFTSVADFSWLTLHGDVNDLEMLFIHAPNCRAGQFPVRPIAVFGDKDFLIYTSDGIFSLPIYGLTEQIATLDKTSYVLRTVIRSSQYFNTFKVFSREGGYGSFVYGFNVERTYGEYTFQAAKELMKRTLSNGRPLYDSQYVDDGFETQGIYFQGFDSQFLIGDIISALVLPAEP